MAGRNPSAEILNYMSDYIFAEYLWSHEISHSSWFFKNFDYHFNEGKVRFCVKMAQFNLNITVIVGY